jgi:ribose-phosphate pyrophosphokinase
MKSYIVSTTKSTTLVDQIVKEYYEKIHLENPFRTGEEDLVKGELVIDEFSDGEFSPNFKHSIRGSRVFLVGSTESSDNILRMCLSIDAARRASSSEIVAVIPYYGYSRQDKKEGKRGTVGAKTLANLFVTSGANRLITVDLHADQIEGFFDIPFDHVSGQRLFENWIKHKFETGDFKDVVLCSPDSGGTKRVDKYWRRLVDNYKISTAYISKYRDKPNSIGHMELTTSVEGKQVVIIDDMIDTGGTLSKAAQLIKDQGATGVWAIATHGIFSGRAISNIRDSILEGVIVSDTIPSVIEKAEWTDKIQVVSCSSQLAKFIKAINYDASTTELDKI